MRARNIKPEFFRDRKMAQLGATVALVYQALWCMSDDGGVAPCDVDRIKGEMFFAWPTIGHDEIADALDALALAGRIRRYRAGDDTFAEIPTLLKHNKPKNPSEYREPRAQSEADYLPLPAPMARTHARAVSPTPVLPQSGGSPTPPLHPTPSHPDTPLSPPLRAVEGNPLLIALDKQPELAPEPAAPPEKPDKPGGGWPADAAAMYEREIGLLPQGRIGKALKPLVAKYGWARVRVWWEAYCEFRPYQKRDGSFPKNPSEVGEKNLAFCSPEDFVKTYAKWQTMCETFSEAPAGASA